MFRLILGFSIIAMGILIFMFEMGMFDKKPNIQLHRRQEIVQAPTPVPEQIKIPALIEEFNAVNKYIATFSVADVVVKIWDNGMVFTLKGSIFYEKPQRFKMSVWSFFGDELDIGSNDEIFWYWSKRERHPTLYYAIHEDHPKTRLKTPFNPVFMRESLGLNEIDVKDAKIVESENDIMVSRQRLSGTGERILYSMFLSKVNKRVSGIVVSSLQGKPLATCEVQYEGAIPKRIAYDWHEEQRSLVLEFKNPVVNIALPETHWQKPKYQPQINMGEEN